MLAKAHGSKCANSSRLLGVGLQLYVEEHDGYFPQLTAATPTPAPTTTGVQDRIIFRTSNNPPDGFLPCRTYGRHQKKVGTVLGDGRYEAIKNTAIGMHTSPKATRTRCGTGCKAEAERSQHAQRASEDTCDTGAMA